LALCQTTEPYRSRKKENGDRNGEWRKEYIKTAVREEQEAHKVWNYEC
jgi:hypothetical protein